MGFPVKIKTKRERLRELADEELGSFEDYGSPEPGEQGKSSCGDTWQGEHPFNILHRKPFEIRSTEELETLIHHVLDNSIDKAHGWIEEYSHDAEQTRKNRGWLSWLCRFQERLIRLQAEPAETNTEKRDELRRSI